MCCGKMIRIPSKREKRILTTGDISIDLDRENREKKDDNNKTSKRELRKGSN